MPESDSIDFPNEADKGGPRGIPRHYARVRSTSEIGVTGGARWCALHRRRIPSHWLEHRRGRRLRHFVWSLWNGWHLVNLFDLSHGLDGVLTDAVITLFRAAMVGALTEDHLRCLLTESGEMRGWKEAEHETPEGFEVLYPLPL